MNEFQDLVSNPELSQIIRTQIAAIAASIFLIVFIIELIRRKELKEKYALLWLAAGVVMLVFSIWRDLLNSASAILGIGYAPALLFLVAMFFGMLLMIHFSIVISDLTEKNKTLAQEIALLKAEMKKTKGI